MSNDKNNTTDNDQVNIETNEQQKVEAVVEPRVTEEQELGQVRQQQETPRELTVTNPIQACNDIFMKPSEVFRSLSVKDNWSWVPFFLIAIVSVLPAYLYFGVIDFDWYVDAQLAASSADLAPAQVEAQRSMMGTAESSRFFALIFTPIMLIIVSAIAALYFTIITRNDEKSVHSFFDWYGMQWWTMMPYLIGTVVSLGILVMQDPGVQLSPSVMAPLSLGYVLGLEVGNPWLSFMNEIRVDRIWGVLLAAYCLQQWTNFSKTKSYVVAAIPSLFVLLIMLAAAAIASA
jgi:hypothetical protein